MAPSRGAGTTAVHPSICRVCSNLCAVEVHVEDGRVARVEGDRDNPLYGGYRCVKGANQRRLYDDPARLLRPLKRMPDGTLSPLPLAEAVGEIAARLRTVIDRDGPRALAVYTGNYFTLELPASSAVRTAFMRAVGSPMSFDPATLDQAGKHVARGLHGVWMAPDRSLQAPQAALMVGVNPMISHMGRLGPPSELLRDFKRWGTQLIAIDPRRSELARHAAIHLQARPGEDAVVIAALLHVILAEELHDRAFAADHVAGLDALRAAVAPFTPQRAAERADVPADDLVAAARIFGGAERAYANAGTGPNMTGKGTLVEYLLLCLNTVCGQWSRAGDVVGHPTTSLPAAVDGVKAQALPPFPAYGLGEPLRARGLRASLAGPPTAALAEEILAKGEGRVRVLLSLGGSPATAWPDQRRTVAALKALDLLVHADVHLSPTAQLADYVIACRLPFELPATTMLGDFVSQFGVGWGYRRPYAQYTPAIMEPPEDSEVVAQWELLYLLARELGLELEIRPGVSRDGQPARGGAGVTLDPDAMPSSDDLLEIVHAGSRVPLHEIKRHPGGAVFDDEPVVVAPRDPGWEGRLDVGNADVLGDLERELEPAADAQPARFPFRLLARRAMHVMCTPALGYPANRPRHNPAFLHPDDLDELGLAGGDVVLLESPHARIEAVVEADVALRRGTVSMSHSFGALPGDDDLRGMGSNTGRLIDTTGEHDRFTGQPRMTNVPVRVVPTSRSRAKRYAAVPGRA